MKLFKQNNLDEFQEQTLLQIERSGCWLAFTGLLIALFGQIASCGYNYESERPQGCPPHRQETPG